MRLSHAFLTVSVLLLGASLGSSATPSLSADESADLTGAYICNGKNFDGSTYQGRVEIVRRKGAFQLVWLSDSDVVGLGMGIRTGNVLSVAFYSGSAGVVAYRIEGQDRLVGEWTVAGADGEVSSETLTKVPVESLDRPPSSAPNTPRPSQEHEQLPRTVKPAREVREL
jgi:hypothetical protein